MTSNIPPRFHFTDKEHNLWSFRNSAEPSQVSGINVVPRKKQ